MSRSNIHLLSLKSDILNLDFIDFLYLPIISKCKIKFNFTRIQHNLFVFLNKKKIIHFYTTKIFICVPYLKFQCLHKSDYSLFYLMRIFQFYLTFKAKTINTLIEEKKNMFIIKNMFIQVCRYLEEIILYKSTLIPQILK